MHTRVNAGQPVVDAGLSSEISVNCARNKIKCICHNRDHLLLANHTLATKWYHFK